MNRKHKSISITDIFYIGCCVLFIILVFRCYPVIVDKLGREDELIHHVRERHLFAHDSTRPTNYTPWAPLRKNMKQRMSHFIINRLSNKTGGFFIECGAFDGRALSNTLLLEQECGWNGLLIEADPVPQAVLRDRNRRAWVADVCLSTSATATKIVMSTALEGDQRWNAGSHIENKVLGKVGDGKRKFEVDCYPLSMLLDAIGVDQVDYFSLDVEGVELDILKTIPFHRIQFQLISVEVRQGNKQDVKVFMESVGFRRIFELVDPSEAIHDDVYERINMD